MQNKILIKYVKHTIDEIINNDEYTNFEEHYNNIYNLIIKISNDDNFYRYLSEQIKLFLETHIIEIKNNFNIYFNTVLYEEKWYDFLEKINTINNTFRYINYKIKQN